MDLILLCKLCLVILNANQEHEGDSTNRKWKIQDNGPLSPRQRGHLRHIFKDVKSNHKLKDNVLSTWSLILFFSRAGARGRGEGEVCVCVCVSGYTYREKNRQRCHIQNKYVKEHGQDNWSNKPQITPGRDNTRNMQNKVSTNKKYKLHIFLIPFFMLQTCCSRTHPLMRLGGPIRLIDPSAIAQVRTQTTVIVLFFITRFKNKNKNRYAHTHTVLYIYTITILPKGKRLSVFPILIIRHVYPHYLWFQIIQIVREKRISFGKKFNYLQKGLIFTEVI